MNIVTTSRRSTTTLERMSLPLVTLHDKYLTSYIVNVNAYGDPMWKFLNVNVPYVTQKYKTVLCVKPSLHLAYIVYRSARRACSLSEKA